MAAYHFEFNTSFTRESLAGTRSPQEQHEVVSAPCRIRSCPGTTVRGTSNFFGTPRDVQTSSCSVVPGHKNDTSTTPARIRERPAQVEERLLTRPYQ